MTKPVSRAVLAPTSKELASYCEYSGSSVRNAVSNLLASMEESGIAPSSETGSRMLRNAAIKAVREATLSVGEQVVLAAADYYDAINGTSIMAKADMSWADHRDSIMSNAVEYIGKQEKALSEGRLSAEQFVQRCYDCGSTQVQRMHCNALDSAMRKSGMYNKNARWARVPSGNETCGFCIMLASRGFVYRSARTAGSHFHASCDCRISNRQVEGYDPKRYESIWRDRETDKIIAAGFKGTTRGKIAEIKRDYPAGYSQWMEYCSKKRPVNAGAQRVHIFGTNEYFQAAKTRDIEPSYFAISEGDVFRLVEKSLAHGWPDINKKTGEWTGFYYFTASKVVGVDNVSGAFTRTFKVNCLSEKHIHAYPTRDRRFDPDEDAGT